MQESIYLEHFIKQYGYLALFVGTFLEGETILILGGIAAKIGYLQLPGVITAAFLGTLAGDQLFFFLGRVKGRKFLATRPTWQSKAVKVHQWLVLNEKAVVVGFRFIYGFRTITPFVIGMSPIKTWEFLLLNIVGALAWATLIGVLGYFFGHALEAVLGRIKHFEMIALSGVALIGGGVWIWCYFRSHKEPRR